MTQPPIQNFRSQLARLDCALASNATIQVERKPITPESQTRHQSQKIEIIGGLAARIAHDFNNLLAVIFGFGQSVVMELEPGSSIHADMVEVLKASERAKALTRQLLAFLSDCPVHTESIDMNHHIDGLRMMLQMLIGEDIELNIQLGIALPQVRMDPTSLHQILANLAVNGRDAMESGGTLTIETLSTWLDEEFFCDRGLEEIPGEYYLIRVTDTGCGMEPDTLDRLFDRFYTTKAMGKGTGLGLTTVNELTKHASGYVTVDSKINQGTSFSIYLPAASSFDAEPSYESEDAVRGAEDVESDDDVSGARPGHQGDIALRWNQLALQ